jgi:hypothetical protein
MNDHDSRQLAKLRAWYKCQEANDATPVRLGLFARAHGVTITDYGTHSKRWIRLFVNGRRPRQTKRLIAAQAPAGSGSPTSTPASTPR